MDERESMTVPLTHSRRIFLGQVTTGTASLALGTFAARPSEAASLVGKAAPALELGLLSGQTWKLGEAKTPLVLVDFWATWCAPCKESFPFYERLAKKYASKVSFLAVSVDESKEPIPAFLRRTGVSFAVGWDQGQKWAAAFSPESMPTLFFLDEKRVVRHVHAGFRRADEAGIDATVARLLAAKS